MGLIDDANSIIEQENQKKLREKQDAERMWRLRTEPVNESQYINPVTDEAKNMLADFVKVMRQYNVLPSPCVIANGKGTKSPSFFGETTYSETITLSLAGFNAWCINKSRYVVTDRGELGVIMALHAQEDCPKGLMHEYFSGYVLPERDPYGNNQVKKKIDIKALKGTLISVNKEILSSISGVFTTYKFDVYVGDGEL